MKIKVDFDLCESNALCEAMAPEVFELDDDDFLQLKTEETTDENLENVKRAVAACPRAAISLEGLSVGDDDLSLDGRVAVVTGAGAGLGRAEALALADAGARVVLNDLPGAADEAADEIRARGGEVAIVEGDVGERATADAMLAAAVDGFGRLDIVVNNAGMTRDRMLFNLSDEEWDDVIRVHLRGHFLLSRNAASYWRERVEGDRRAGLRPDRQHRLRGVPRRLARPGQLRRRQGRHRRAHAVHRPRAGQDRRPRQRDLPARPHRDDRAGLRRGHLRPGGRPLLARPRRAAGRLPRLARRRRGSPARSSSCTAGWWPWSPRRSSSSASTRPARSGTCRTSTSSSASFFAERDPSVGFAADSIMQLTV